MKPNFSAKIFLGIFLVNSASLKASLTRQNTIKENIKSLEETEQRLVFVHDRVSKGKDILDKDQATDSINNLTGLSLNQRLDVTPKSTEIKGENTELGLSVTNFLALTQLFSDLTGGNVYKQIDLESFSFTPLSGYEVGLTTINK